LFPAVQAQLFNPHQEFTRQDTLRGSITPERNWWDVIHYDLNVRVFPDKKSISGSNIITYKVLEEGNIMQIDLQEPMKITRIIQNGAEVDFEREGSVFWAMLDQDKDIGSEEKVIIFFEGNPKVALRPPWDGGITWNTDQNGKPFIASSNQGIGASIWWPNKDHAYDEPDNGMMIRVRVPENLMDVSNGRLDRVEEHGDGTKTWHWKVTNPINNYGVNINIGDYVHFGEKYPGEKGMLDMDYYVLSYNKEIAMKHFADARRTLEALEYWFGPYPFYEDSYKLVEAPYLGMEHQSSVTYGNDFMMGYKGTDLSSSGWGLKFDFIIIHESGHEWFANNITYKDVADMWIHESFTNYSENLFLEYFYGPEAGREYVLGTRLGIKNDRPMVGIYDVHFEGSGDMYNKGGNMLHTIRNVINNDVLWRNILRGLNKDYYHQTVTSAQIENYISEKAGMDMSKIFDQYLRDIRIPTLEYTFKDDKLRYRWSNTVSGFDMPVRVSVDGIEYWLDPTTNWKRKEINGQVLVVDKNFYIGSMNTLGN
jgi:aminopeptidase N